jgi:hypothetical protein
MEYFLALELLVVIYLLIGVLGIQREEMNFWQEAKEPQIKQGADAVGQEVEGQPDDDCWGGPECKRSRIGY